ncbi:MAG: MBOAT family protein [Chitinophagia bacterium]|nr:MBOAT family protein [Chitinophagia bacterium]
MLVFHLDGFLHQFLYDAKNPLLFNNGFFIYFFAIFISLYYLVRNSPMAKSVLVSIFSLYFFYKASGWFVGLVILSAVIDYALSNLIYSRKKQASKNALLALSIVINLGMLFYFKYTNFFLALTGQLFSTHISPLNILLPVGISFYTFENLSYTIDVYRGEFVPERKFFHYLLFLSFFPKLMMGPIVRARDFIPQLHQPYKVSSFDFAKGFYLITSGLFKKLVISDYLTLNLVNYVFDDPSRHTGLECMFALFAYAIVIYCDFSGYSDVAIGIARWMGITIPPNFLSPYQSKTITEFWRRWHISLSSWLKDYSYIFWLGGNRNGKFRTYVNLFVTMLLGGFWHGANWTFIVWGAMHGTALAVHKVWMEATKSSLSRINNTWLYNFIAQLFTFLFVCFCWIFFKSANFQIATDMIHQMVYDFSPGVFGEFFSNYHNVLYLMLLGYFLHLLPDDWPDRVIPKVEKAPLVAYIAVFVVFLVIYSQFKSAVPVMPIYLQF